MKNETVGRVREIVAFWNPFSFRRNFLDVVYESVFGFFDEVCDDSEQSDKIG